MLFDWFTIAAQALNFLILVWLMKRFLYHPILNAIDAREKLIAKELADAASQKAEAQKEHAEFQKKNEEFDQQRATLLTKATEAAKTERARLLDEARKAADALSAKRQAALLNDAGNLNQAISRWTQQEVFAITRKALADLATVSLEERMGEVFDRRLHALDGPAKAVLGAALRKNSEPALVRSAFDLPASQRAAIQNALNETFSADIHVRFETAPDLVCGIELAANGQKVGWSIAEYLASLEKGLGELLKPKDKPVPKPEAKPAPDATATPDGKPVKPPLPTAKPEPKPEAKPAPAEPAKPEAKPATPPTARPEPKPAEPTVKKPETKAKPEEAAKPAVEPAPPAKAQLTAEPKAEAKPEAKDEPC